MHRASPLAWLCLAGIILSLLACNFPPANNPRSVAESFINRLKNMEFKAASEYATPNSTQILLYLDSMRATIPQDRVDESKVKGVTIVQVKETGDSAVVQFRLGADEAQNLDLIKVDGNWKVDFKKQL